MEEWQRFDTIDVLLSRISKSYKHKSAAVKQWTADLIEDRIWRGSNTTRTRVRMASKNNKKKGSPRLRQRERSSATPPIPVKVWTKEEREEATRQKADEADEAAANGVRRSRRARVPSEKVLNGE
jgi:hypothetical protein